MGFDFRKIFTAEVFKIGSGYVLGAIIVAYCLYIAATGVEPVLQVLLCIFGFVLGWIAGMMITPVTRKEKAQFSEYAKALAVFLSGFALAKFDAWAKPTLVVIAHANPKLLLTFALTFSICFLVAAVYTFVGRSYVLGTDVERQQKRQRAIEDLKDALQVLAHYN